MKSLHTLCASSDRYVIGGKAMRLCELVRLELPVTPAVVLTVDDIDRVRSCGAVDRGVLDEIRAALTIEPNGVAVRSSATDEDGELSWAGQFATHLFVGTDGLAEAIISCARALDSEVVTAYAKEHNLPRPRLALVIQEMVPATVAGVLFTNDPTTQCEEMVVEAVYGVGESLVSGSREPKRYYLSRETGEVLRHNGADAPVLGSEVIKELHAIGQKLEAHFGRPQDIEWAIDEGGKIFLTQCRDVTTVVVDLETIRTRVIDDVQSMLEAEHERLRSLGIDFAFDVISDTNIAELLTRHPCRMTYGLFTYTFGHGLGGIRTGRNLMGYDIGAELQEGFVLLVGGQPRVSIVHDALTFRLGGVEPAVYSRAIRHYLDQIREDQKRANYPEVGLYVQTPDDAWIGQVFGEESAVQISTTYAEFHAAFSGFEIDLDHLCREYWVPAWRAKMAAFKARIISGEATIELFRELIDALRVDACREFVRVNRVGFFAFDRLRRRLQALYPEEGDQYLNVLTSGVSIDLNPNLRFGMALRAWKMGEMTEDELFEEFGHLGVHELDIALPRYAEQPEVLSRLADEIRGNPGDELAETARASAALQTRLLTESPGRDDPHLAHDIDVARRFLPMREVTKFEFLRAYDLIRRVLLGLERTLEWPKGLIFFLDPLDLVSEPDWNELRGRAKSRQKRWNEERQLYIPPILFSDELDAIGRPPSLEGVTVLDGVGVTNFIAEGEVVVMRSPDDTEAVRRLRPGSILVTETTDPAWTPVLSVIGKQGGLVTEVGGLLAHGAVYAREMGIAAVLNVPSATVLLKTGMRVRVNGPKGRIEIL